MNLKCHRAHIVSLLYLYVNIVMHAICSYIHTSPIAISCAVYNLGCVCALAKVNRDNPENWQGVGVTPRDLDDFEGDEMNHCTPDNSS